MIFSPFVPVKCHPDDLPPLPFDQFARCRRLWRASTSSARHIGGIVIHAVLRRLSANEGGLGKRDQVRHAEYRRQAYAASSPNRSFLFTGSRRRWSNAPPFT